MVTKYREIDTDSRIAIDVDKLIVGTRLPFDVFIKDRGIIKHLFNKGMVFTNISKEVLKEKGVSEVYISSSEGSAINTYLSANNADKKISPYEDPVVFKQYSFHKEEHHQIDKNLLLPDTSIYFSLFVLDKFDIKSIVEASEKSPAVINESMLNTPGDFLIKKSDIPLYHDYLNSLLKQKAVSDKDTNIKAMAIKENSKIVIKSLLDDPRSGEKIKESNAIVNNMIDCMLENRDAIYNLLTLRGYDYYTYTHSVNVGALSIGLGIAIDLKREDIEKLGMGAILHDIGKSAITHEILNKQGKLNETEYRMMKNHVIEGEKILRTHKEIPGESFDAVLQHHEKLTGKGYPFHLFGNSIKLFGRIAAIADCYDALTTQRPYKPAFTPFYALSLISKETGDYDQSLLKAFIKMLGKIR
jgi:putative nucleotidyltransferase with HDIG domain